MPVYNQLFTLCPNTYFHINIKCTHVLSLRQRRPFLSPCILVQIKKYSLSNCVMHSFRNWLYPISCFSFADVHVTTKTATTRKTK